MGLNLVPDDSSASKSPAAGSGTPPGRGPAKPALPGAGGGPSSASTSTGSASGVPSRPSNPDRVSPLVAEIRERLSEITARELALRRREREIEQQYRRLEQLTREAVQRELQDARRQLEARTGEMDAEAAELVTRRQRLDRREEELAHRQTQQEQSHKDLLHSVETLRRRLEAERGRQDVDRQALLQRIETVRQREKDLERRIQLARDEIVRQRGELTAQRETLQRDAAELERQWRSFEESTAEENQQWTALQARAKEIERQQGELEARRAAFEEQRTETQTAASESEQLKKTLADKQREAERQAHAAREQRKQLGRQQEELEARRREHQDAQAALEEKVRKFEAREREFREQVAGLEAESGRLAELEARMEARRKEIDALHEKAAETERAAQQQRDEALALQDQIEARDTESRQIAMAQELERQDLDHEQAVLVRLQGEFDAHRAQGEQELEQARGTLRERAEELRRSETSVLAAPRRWWLRSAALAAAAAVAAAWGWWRWETPLYRGAAELRIQSQSRSPQRVVREHAAALLSPEQFEADFADSRLARLWTAARDAGQAQAVPIADALTVRLELTTPDAEAGRQLVQAAAESYARRVNGAPTAPALPEMYADLAERRNGVVAELKDIQRRQTEAETLLATTPEPVERDQTQAEVQQLRAQHAETVKMLEEERGRLTALLAGDVPANLVDAAALEKALAADEAYQEDLKELLMQAKQYQTELAIGMVLVVDPLKEVQRALQTFAATLNEQRNLNPPAAVSTSLERCAAQVEQFEARLRTFQQNWHEWRMGVERAKPDQNLVELVERQNKAADGLRKLIEAWRALVDGCRAQLDQLADQSGGGTRGVVVAAVLRGDLSRLQETLPPLAEAAGASDLAVNFRLNAADRQLRGLRQRMAQRQEATRQQLQMEADRMTRQDREAQLLKIREAVAQLETRRETLVTTLIDKLDALRGLDEALRQRRALETEIRRNQADLERLETQAQRLEATLAEARRSGPQPDRVAVLMPRVEQIAGIHRRQHAALVAGGTFAAVWLLSALLLLKNPLRGRRPRAGDALVVLWKAEA